ncbi:MAG TPA: hypothetical protein VMT53_14955 [Terriglobales bacterium]|nr:hypothetical protein [Terriglobales bacterium]
MIGDRPGDVFRHFRDHISSLLNRTITDARLSLTHLKDKPFAQFAFRDEADMPIAAPLFSKNLFLAASQHLEVRPEAGKWRLYTLEYNYHLLEAPSPDSRWIIRWEYKSHKRLRNEHPRHHVHLDVTLKTSAGDLNLDHLHLSTGWVTIEEVIRFLIAEVGIKAKSKTWDDDLLESEALFKEWTGRSV